MADLEERKMLADFARPGMEWRICLDCREVTGPSCFCQTDEVDAADAYESDPAAACSLLPKLAAAWWLKRLNIRLCDVTQPTGWTRFTARLSGALAEEDNNEVCRLIAAAVKEMQK